MSIMNKLLAEIVVLSGGTVSNPNNRNQLLRDWLDAVSPPQTRQVYTFNGVNSYIETPVLNFSGDFTIELTIKRESAIGGQFIFASQNGSLYGMSLYSTGDWGVGTGSIQVFGVTTVASNLSINTDYIVRMVFTSTTNTLTTTINGVQQSSNVITPPPAINSSTATRIATRPEGGFFFNGMVYNYSDSLGNAFKVDDGWANNPTVANSGTGADATLINGVESGWSEIPA